MSTAPRSIPMELEGLQLGPLLGKGSYGRVYRGWYHQEAVAVKVCRVLSGGRLDHRASLMRRSIVWLPYPEYL